MNFILFAYYIKLLMNVDTRVFLRKKFKDYYWRARVPAPDEVHRREFGVGTLEDKIKLRHKSFASEKKLVNFLKREAPSYISYSSAYYEFPENQPMSEKNWLGADLVFDLDAQMSFFDAGVFDRVKREVVNLVDFLVSDFGFARKDARVNFSGSKGYHVHISSDDVRLLSSDERREIVDYVTGSGLDLKYFLGEVEVDGVVSGRGRGYVNPATTVRGPVAGSVGWAGRIYGAAHDFVEKSSVEEFKRIDGIGPKKAGRLFAEREKNLKALESGNWRGMIDLTPKLLQKVVDEKAVNILGDTDKMVTIDTARLMRLPDTLHGGSGLLAMRVKDVEGFNPLVDAVVFKGDDVKIKPVADVLEFDLMENRWGPYESGVEVSVPEFVGVYLMLKQAAEVAG